MQTGIVVFDYTAWSVRYPELSAWVAEPLAQQYFNEACLYCDNTACSPVQYIEQRSPLLGMLTSHIAALNAPLGGQPSSKLVGRIKQAVEGSIQVESQMDYPAGSSQWYMQTKYGAAFWQATVQYRKFRYVPGPERNFNAYGNIGFTFCHDQIGVLWLK